jgi:putative ABC transport system permease protein
MIHSQVFKLAFDALRANKVRAFLTMFGVVIGSACIVLVVTIALISRTYIITLIEGVGSNIVWAELRRTSAQAATLGDEITLSDMDAVRNSVPNVVQVASTHDVQSAIVAGGVERAVTLVAVTEGFQAIRNLLVTRGRYFDQDDMASASKVCLLTEKLAAAIFPGVDPIGKELRVEELRFTVIGVFRERVATFGNSEIVGETVLVPFGLLKGYAGTDSVKVLYAQAANPESVPGVTHQVEQVLLGRHRPGPKYDSQNLSEYLEVASKVSFAMTVVLLGVGSVTLLVSGVGIMNIMLVTVTERTREIGLRKAIGARNREILYQFLLEALIISGTGATLGISIVASIPFFVRPLLPPGVTIPISGLSMAVAFGVSCLTGVIFGYLPANRAAKLQPTEALRYE